MAGAVEPEPLPHRRGEGRPRLQPAQGPPRHGERVLKRGQTLFWDGNTIHRGKLPPGVNERLVLTGGLCKYDPDEPKQEPDRRFQWRVAENIGPALPDRVRLWYERW